MGKIAVHEFISLDGVYEDPRWTVDFGFDPKMGETLARITTASDAILLGRKTYEMFYPAWSTRTAEDDPGAPFFNDTQKYVVSGTLTDPAWNNTTVVGAYDQGAIQELKDKEDGSLYVSGSGTLVRGLLDDGLVDELHLFVYPLTRGEGPKLFDGTPARKFTMASSKAYDNGVLYARYHTAA